MTANQNCPQCGTPLPPDAPGGACPRCLLAAGLEDTRGVAPMTPGAVPAPSPAELERVFPELEIQEVIGRGGMGIVYRARQVNLDRIVALKVLPAAGVGGLPGFAERFSREARMLARLDHPNIVRIHEFGERGGSFYLTMEFVDGVNLRQLMARERMLPKDALKLVPQVCDALQYAHDTGVVHRDIKPENILIDRRGRVKIADFGLAKMVEQGPRDYTITGTGDVMGTLHYMAPEQLQRPTEVDHRADIYSLGVVFYEMLTGELPIGRFRPPSETAEVDRRLDEIVMRALEREREHRYQSADDVRSDTVHVSHEAPGRRTRSGQPVRGRAAAPAGAEHRHQKPRLCRQAVIGALALPAAILLAILIVITSLLSTDMNVQNTGVMIAFLAFFFMVATGWVLSIVAWVRVGTSRGALRGLGFAVTGTILPVMTVPLLMFLSFFLFSTAVDHEAPNIVRDDPQYRPQPVEILTPENEDEQRGVLPLWQAFQKRVDQSGIATPRMQDLFRNTTWRPRDLNPAIAECEVGPMVYPHGRYDVAHVTVSSSRYRATFTVSRLDGRWYFTSPWQVVRLTEPIDEEARDE